MGACGSGGCGVVVLVSGCIFGEWQGIVGVVFGSGGV